MSLLNVNLSEGTCLEERPVSYNFESKPLNEQLAEIVELSEGLTNPRIGVNNGDMCHDEAAEMYVSGTRELTDDERASITAERELDRRRRDHMNAFPG